MSDAPTIVILHYAKGESVPTCHVIGNGALVFSVDDNTPGDRVYEMTLRSPPELFRELIPSISDIGHCGDAKHGEAIHKIEQYLRSKDL